MSDIKLAFLVNWHSLHYTFYFALAQCNIPDSACTMGQVWGWLGPVWWLWPHEIDTCIPGSIVPMSNIANVTSQPVYAWKKSSAWQHWDSSCWQMWWNRMSLNVLPDPNPIHSSGQSDLAHGSDRYRVAIITTSVFPLLKCLWRQ
jgi:hypothetical protein